MEELGRLKLERRARKGSGNTMCHTYHVSMPGMPSRQASIGSAKSWVRHLSSSGCRNLFGGYQSRNVSRNASKSLDINFG